jgi:hypothetical protein
MAKKKLKIEFGAITNSNIEQVRLARLMGAVWLVLTVSNSMLLFSLRIAPKDQYSVFSDTIQRRILSGCTQAQR